MARLTRRRENTQQEARAMSEKEEAAEEGGEDGQKPPSALKTLLFNAAGALVLGGAAAGVAFIAPIGGSPASAPAPVDKEPEKQTKSYEDIVFVNLEPMVVTLGPNAASKYLKISISIETSKDHVKTVERLAPRFRDVLNTYLRAVDEKDLVEPFAMTRLRAQMLRRIQVAASSDAVSDVLITDFVLN